MYDTGDVRETLPGFQEQLAARIDPQFMRVTNLTLESLQVPEALLGELVRLRMTNRCNDTPAGARAMMVLCDSAIGMALQFTPEIEAATAGCVTPEYTDYLGLFDRLATLLQFTIEPTHTSASIVATLISATRPVVPVSDGNRYTSPLPTALQLAYWSVMYCAHRQRCGAEASEAVFGETLRRLSLIQVA